MKRCEPCAEANYRELRKANWTRSAEKNKEKIRERRAKRNEERRPELREQYKKHYRNHRVTRLEHYRRMRQRHPVFLYRAEQLEAQGGACAICGSTTPDTKSGWHVDHDHAEDPRSTRAVNPVAYRGVLCQPCNVHLVGYVERRPWMRSRLPLVDEYLAKWDAIIRDRKGRVVA
jgi:hypothetical protein